MICLSRREYRGSSPYTDEELRTINHGSEEERAKFLQEQGVLIALFVDGIIQTLSLPKAGGLTVVGWSMGNVFTLALRACISDLPADTQERLKSYSRSFIVWGTILPPLLISQTNPEHLSYFIVDPPVTALGFPWNFDQPQISQEVLLATFAKRITTHFKHVDLDSKDPSKLDQIGDPSKKPTSETMTPEELSSTLDFTPCFKCDIPLLVPTFSLAVSNQMIKALLDSQVREDWGGVLVWYICGDSNPAIVQTSPWLLEGKIKSEDINTNINFKLIKDANHLVR